MAALSDADRILVTRAWIQRIYVELSTRADLNGAQIKAAVDAADDWCDANQAGFVAALPAAFRNNTTADQKTALLVYVALKRAGLL